jgi:carbon monoxide dehydrogenase subunit G
MKASHTQVLPHGRDEVWRHLMDFQVLARTLPGVESLEPVDLDTCLLTVRVLIPSITGSYTGTVRVVERDPTSSYRLRGEAKGRLGWVRGDAEFELADEAGGTAVSSTMDFHTGGILAGVGQRFMEGIARSMIREFFEAFDAELGKDGKS